MRRQLDAVKDELSAAQHEVERLQRLNDNDITGSKEFKALQADIEILKQKVQSGEFMEISPEALEADGSEIEDPTDSTVTDQKAPRGLDALRARLAREAEQRKSRRSL